MKFLVFLFFSLISLGIASEKSLWRTECYQVGEDILQEDLHFSETAWTRIFTAFEDEHCEIPYLRFEQSYKVKTTGHDADLTHLETAYTPLSEETAEALDFIDWCGLHSWQAHEKKIVTGQDCGDYLPPKLGEMSYTIFRKDSQGLRLGKAGPGYNGKTPESRHQDLHEYLFQKIVE